MVRKSTDTFFFSCVSALVIAMAGGFMCLSYLSVHPTSPQESLEGIWHKHPLGLKDADTGHQIKKTLQVMYFAP